MFCHDWLDLPSKSLLHTSLQWQSSTSQRQKSCQIVFSHITSTGILIFQWHAYDSPVCCRLLCINSKYWWPKQFHGPKSLFWSLSSLPWTRNFPPFIKFAAIGCVRKRQILNPAFQCILLSHRTSCRPFWHYLPSVFSLRLYASCLCAWREGNKGGGGCCNSNLE